MSMSPKRPRGAPRGNTNAFKHGFYTRRLKKNDLNGVESTDTSGLVEEIALIRVFTRRLLESSLNNASFYDLAETLRILCLASSTITRVIKTQYLLSMSDTGLDDEIAAAIHQINLDFQGRLAATTPTLPASLPPDSPDEV
jgi:hypothetical protein